MDKERLLMDCGRRRGHGWKDSTLFVQASQWHEPSKTGLACPQSNEGTPNERESSLDS